MIPLARRLPLLLLLFVCSLASSTGVAQPGASEETVELRFSWWGGNEVHRALLASVREFERRHPTIRVKPEYTGWVGHLERMTTQIAGGTAPDLMQVNWSWLVLFSRDGRGFYDLDTLGEHLDLTQFDDEARATGLVAGKLNALPTSLTARLFYFNETTFAKAGLPVPSTWEELFAAGPVFRERLGEGWYPLDVEMLDMVALARSWFVQQHGRPLIDPQRRALNATVDELVDLARFYERLVAAHVIPPARERASYGNLAPQEMPPWIAGRYAGTYQWISAVGKYVEALPEGQRVVLAPYPMQPGATDSGTMYRPSMMFAINRGTRHPREAAMLLDFLLNDPFAVRAMGLKRGVPTSRAAVATLAADGTLTGLSAQGQAQLAALPHAVHESGWYEHARVRDGFIDVLNLLAYGRIDAQEAGRRWHDEINRILSRTIR